MDIGGDRRHRRRTVQVAGRRLLHPQQQVAQYVEYIDDFNQLHEQGLLTVGGFAWLHNADRSDIASLRSAALADVAAYPIFSGDERGAAQTFLKGRLLPDGASQAADDFLAARIRPSKKLLDHVQEQISGHDAFTLLDEQLVAYDLVRQALEDSRRSNNKTVVLIKGGPGTGKSVIATTLLGDLSRRGYNISHATGSKAFTTTLKDRVGRRAGELFRYFNNFTDADQNDLDVLLADEAHRIRISSNHRFTRKDKRSEIPQIDELVQVARVPVFLLDERQVVRPAEIGTVEAIRDAARRNGAELLEVDLNGQFRSGGSQAYIDWVEGLLGFTSTVPWSWPGDDAFEVTVVSSPTELDRWVRDHEESGNTARLAAGFCWPWSDPTPEGTLVDDVVIDGWRRPWNAKPEKKVKDAPTSNLWASDPRGINQVGCIYTAQGFEYDYAGVILGSDLVRRDGHWVAHPENSFDTVVKRGANFDELVKHTYKVLLTRGMKGCALYSVDPETHAFLAELNPASHPTLR